MRRFSFRLQPVLLFRQKREEEALQALARAQGEFYHKITEMEVTAALLEESLKEAPRGNFSPEELFHLALWRQHLNEMRGVREKEVEKARKNLSACRRHAEVARREKMVLEKLKERQLLNYRQEENRAAQKELDEKGLQAVWWRKGGNYW